ncbi:class I SAM-dependent methyltransferase [Microvirga makkahensis]|uniref:Class I SAM-dependent methyltransferase n=1 Tax=Microvirga makkahensis TaxID=1128670 RepID=A0A7X3SQH5_9HYPH|nr:class I SAM-dependent methyltransferase [Microvirga makkahensis]MXQ13581.1 class I SAM-dependent methyltransferase [Microvirga makkahensis]
MRVLSNTLRIPLRRLGFDIVRSKPPAGAAVLSTRAPELLAKHVSGCRVFPSREVWLTTIPKGSIIAEIGVANGDFSEAFLRVCKPGCLYLVDAWHTSRFASGLERVSSRFAEDIKSGRVKIRRGYSTDVLKMFEPESLDLAYIDTTHAYALTAEELAQCEPLVKPHGRIAGHDYCEGNAVTGNPYGVIRAVHEFCLARCWIFDALSLAPDGHLSFSLRRG